MASEEDIMLILRAQDNATSVINGVGNAAAQMGDTVKGAGDEAANSFENASSSAQSMGQTINSAAAQGALGFNTLSNAASDLISKISNGKTVSEMLIGTPAKAETNSVLVNLMSQTEQAARDLNEHVNTVTNNSLVSMQNLIPALNAFKTATGATDKQIYDATDGIANFGAKVLAQTGSVELSEQAMMDLSKGIKGACASLDQYGITTDALKRTGLWNGEEDDIEGYIAAVEQLTGDTTELMETSEGLDARLGKAFSSAGKQIGNNFLPFLKDAKRGLLDLNSATGGGLFAGILVAGGALESLSSITFQISNIASGAKAVHSAYKTAASGIKDFREGFKKLAPLTKAQSAAEKALNSVKVVSASLNWAMLGPILLIIAAIVALIAIVYLVGKHFGLWNDPMEMGTVILGHLKNALSQVADFLMGVFTSAWNAIKGPLTTVWNIIKLLWNTFSAFAKGQISIQQAIMIVWTTITNLLGNILKGILNKVIQFGASLLKEAVKGARQFLNNFINGITSLPSRVWSILLNAVRMIQNAVRSAGNAARNVAQAIWDGLTGKLQEFGSWILDTILSPIRTVADAVGGLFGAAGSEDLPHTALAAGTFIGGGYMGMPLPVNNTTNNNGGRSINVGEINMKLDNVSDTQAKKILVQALDGLEQMR